MTAAGMSVDVKPVMTPACSLPTPRIEFGQNDSVVCTSPQSLLGAVADLQIGCERW